MSKNLFFGRLDLCEMFDVQQKGRWYASLGCIDINKEFGFLRPRETIVDRNRDTVSDLADTATDDAKAATDDAVDAVKKAGDAAATGAGEAADSAKNAVGGAS